MRHADDHLLDALRPALLDGVLQQRDQRVAALEREALLADVLGVEIALEALGRGQMLEQCAALGGVPARARAFDALDQPAALLEVAAVRNSQPTVSQ